MIKFCEDTLKHINESTIVIPGHGPVTNTATLKEYISMLKTVRSRVAALIEEGKTLQEIKDTKPTEDFDKVYGPETSSLGFINRVFASLSE